MFLLSEVSSDMIFDQILKPETDETFFRNVEAALLFEICVLGSDLVPGVVSPWWHAAFIFASTRRVKSYLAPFGLSVQKITLFYI